MFRQMLRFTAAGTFIVLTSLPASAQPQVRIDIPLPGLEIRVGHRAPPPLQREYRPSRPSRDHVWIPGSWDWQRNDWVWIQGRWDRPSEGHASWIKARYVREGPGWRYEPGHWSNQRVIEGEEYRRWKDESRRGRGHDDDHRRDRDRDRDHDRD